MSINVQGQSASAQNKLARQLLERLISLGAIKQGTFTLASGLTSKYYVDLRKALCWPGQLGPIADQVVRRVRQVEPRIDAWAGVAVGGIPLAVGCSAQSGHPFMIVRAERKDHGTGKMVEGPEVDDRDDDGAPLDPPRVVLVEDVLTTGGSAVRAIHHLEDAGMTVVGVVAVFDRLQGGLDAIMAPRPGKGVPSRWYLSLAHLNDLRALWPDL